MTARPITSDLTAACDLSPQQIRTWTLALACPQSYASHCTILIEGRIDPGRLRAAVAAVVDRHPMLRVRFTSRPAPLPPLQSIAAEPVRIIETVANLGVDVGHGTHSTCDDGSLAATLGRPSVDLEGETPLIALHRHAADRWSLTITAPAYCLDGRSLHLLYRDLATTLGGDAAEEPQAVAPLSYLDAAVWLNDILEAPDREAGRAYWRERQRRSTLEGWQAITAPTRSSFVPARMTVDLPDLPRVRSIRDVDAPDTAAMMATVWRLLLARAFGRGASILGVAQDGRRHPELQSITGPWSKYVPIEIPLDGRERFADVAARIANAMDEAATWHEYYRPDPPDWYLAYAFAVETRPLPVQCGGVRLSLVEQWSCPDRFDLKLVGGERSGAPWAEIHYDAARQSSGDVTYLCERFSALYAEASERPGGIVRRFSGIGPAEQRQLLHDWNGPDAPLAPRDCVHGMFEAQAASTPRRLAIVSDEDAITFQDLNRRANQLARALRRLGISMENRVGLCVERSTSMVVALLGIMKTGAAFVPLDPAYPEKRLAYMLGDAGVSLVLTQRAVRHVLPECGIPIVALDDLAVQLDEEADTDLDVPVVPANLSSVLYTSGSTGEPKGVMNTHAGLCNRLRWGQAEYALDADDRVLQKTTVVFDVAQWELFWPLTAGATMVLARHGGQRDLAYLVDMIARHRVTVVHFIPSMLRLFIEAESLDACTSLHRIFCSGEPLSVATQRRVDDRLGVSLHNLYGPTETSIEMTAWSVPHGWRDSVLPIGRPITNTQVQILSEGELAPVGVTGELCISGASLARGYVNRPALTAERFIPNPWGRAGERMYCSGDLAKWRADGLLECLGREDYQVKIGGCRIELGEIEAVLLRMPAVSGAVVIALPHPSGDARLVAFVLAAASETLESALRAHAAASLPGYMIPTAFVPLTQWPLTATGKLDRQALMEMVREHHEDLARPYVAPRSALERTLCDCWRGVLGLSRRVGIDEDFFTIGGHSLLAVQLAFNIRRVVDCGLRVADLLEHTTVAALAAFLERTGGADERQRILVQLRAGVASATPLYLVHPIDGGVLCYQDLAQRLDPETPVYAIHAPPPDADFAQGARLEPIAAGYLDLIERHSAGRPYQLAGWSFGGLLAYEMGQQARARGRAPTMLLLIDPSQPGADYDTTWSDDGMTHAFITGLIRSIGAADRLPVTDIPPSLDFDEQLQRAVRQAYLAPDIDVAQCRTAFLTYCGNTRAIRAYRAEPYHGPVVLITPQKSADEQALPDAWPGLLPADTPRATVGDDHQSMVRGLHAGRIAAIVQGRVPLA